MVPQKVRFFTLNFGGRTSQSLLFLFFNRIKIETGRDLLVETLQEQATKVMFFFNFHMIG